MNIIVNFNFQFSIFYNIFITQTTQKPDALLHIKKIITIKTLMSIIMISNLAMPPSAAPPHHFQLSRKQRRQISIIILQYYH